MQAATAGMVATLEAAMLAAIAHAPDWAAIAAELRQRVAELTDDSLRYERPERWLTEYCRGVREAADKLLAALAQR